MILYHLRDGTVSGAIVVVERVYRAAPGAANTGCRRAEKQLFVLIIPEFFAVSNETATKS